jgi:hypothetical protein
MFTILRRHTRALLAGILVCLATFVLFYLMTVFALSWGTTALHYSRGSFLLIQLFGILFFAFTIPISPLLAERGRRPLASRRSAHSLALYSRHSSPPALPELPS